MPSLGRLYIALGTVGSAIGASVGGASWAQRMYREIEKWMNDTSLAEKAYTDLYTFIQTYTWGTSQRVALIEAYKSVQRLIMIVEFAFTASLFFLSS